MSEETTNQQILSELATIRKRAGCIGVMMLTVVCPACLYLILTMAGCHYANFKLNEEFEKSPLHNFAK